jgi:hypothetical protein
MAMKGRALGLLLIGLLAAALIGACGGDETADQPSASELAQATTAVQTVADEPATTPDEPAATQEEPATTPDQRAANHRQPTATPDQPTATPDKPTATPDEPTTTGDGSVKDEPPPPDVDESPGLGGTPTCVEAKKANRHDCRARDESPSVPSGGASSTKPGESARPVDPNAAGTGEEPNKPTLGAEQEHYSNAEVRCDMAADTPEEKDACY